MGNYKFKFSDMIPNAWFYKLKNQNYTQKPKIKNRPITKSPTFSASSSSSAVAAASPQLLHQRKSYHFTRYLPPPTPDNNSASQLLEPPRKSTRNRRSINKNRPINRSTSPRLLVTSSVSADCSCRASPEEHQNIHPGSCSSEDDNSVFPELGSQNGDKPFDKILTSCHCGVKSDISITMTMTKDSKVEDFDLISEFELRPIITKINKVEKNEEVCNMRRISHSTSKEQTIVKKLSVNNNSKGVKLRTNSPRIASKRFMQVQNRKSVSSRSGGGGRGRSLAESFVVVKTSKDPLKDFTESMVEMIMENNMRTSKDLEDLLTCYLSLNSDKYHDMIIKVFKQIWFEIIDVKF